eukprot:1159062-Pelagomonas_calceolata.AAC.3
MPAAAGAGEGAGTPAADGTASSSGAGLGMPPLLQPLQQPTVAAGARRISQLIREEQQAWGEGSSGGRGPPEGQSNSGGRQKGRAT